MKEAKLIGRMYAAASIDCRFKDKVRSLKEMYVDYR